MVLNHWHSSPQHQNEWTPVPRRRQHLVRQTTIWWCRKTFLRGSEWTCHTTAATGKRKIETLLLQYFFKFSITCCLSAWLLLNSRFLPTAAQVPVTQRPVGFSFSYIIATVLGSSEQLFASKLSLLIIAVVLWEVRMSVLLLSCEHLNTHCVNQGHYFHVKVVCGHQYLKWWSPVGPLPFLLPLSCSCQHLFNFNIAES